LVLQSNKKVFEPAAARKLSKLKFRKNSEYLEGERKRSESLTPEVPKKS
jgi:hypothetical protein